MVVPAFELDPHFSIRLHPEVGAKLNALIARRRSVFIRCTKASVITEGLMLLFEREGLNGPQASTSRKPVKAARGGKRTAAVQA